MNRRTVLLTVVVLWSLLMAETDVTSENVPGNGAADGYILEVSPESEPSRIARLEAVSARKAGPIIICHRGAWAFAPENSLEAYKAAIEYGADGCEVDVRRTSDGVLVCSHDEFLGRVIVGVGDIREHTYSDLSSMPLRCYGAADSSSRIPTFAAVVELARKTGTLLYLDVKAEGIDGDIARILDEADAWDHVVYVNDKRADGTFRNPRYKKHPWKRCGVIDWNPAAVKAAIPAAGSLIQLEDPRLAAQILGRPAYTPIPMPDSVYTKRSKAVSRKTGDDRSPQMFMKSLENAVFQDSEAALEIMMGDGAADRYGTRIYYRCGLGIVLARIWAAGRLGGNSVKSQKAVSALEEQIKSPTPYPGIPYFGMNSAAAAEALAELNSVESVSVITEAYDRGWWNFLPRRIPVMRVMLDLIPYKERLVRAVGDIECEESKSWLQGLLDPGKDWDRYAKRVRTNIMANALCPIVESLLKQDLSREELLSLMNDKRQAVRGTAIRYCLDNPSETGDAALREAAPWALELPRANQRGRRGEGATGRENQSPNLRS